MHSKKKFAVFSVTLFLCALFTLSAYAEDVSPVEYATGYVPPPAFVAPLDDDPPILLHKFRRDIPLPVSYDMRQHNRLPPPRNQDHWGTCWAHAAIGSMESAWLTQYPSDDVNLSEMHLAYFVYGDKRPGKSFTMSEKNKGILQQGGNDYQAIAFMSQFGTVSESILPYSDTKPGRLPENYKPSGIRLKSAYHLPGIKADPETTKRFVLETGGVSINYTNDYGAYRKSPSGKTVFYCKNPKSIAHAVLVVGWDDNLSREEFPEDMRPKNDGAWLIRNSWGTGWTNTSGDSVGDEGCFWMSYEYPIGTPVVFIPAKSEKGLKHYGYEGLRVPGNLNAEWGANIFMAESEEFLKYIGFQTYYNNTSYDIYVYDLGTQSPDSPVSGTLLASIEGGYAPYRGWHTEEISGEIRISAGHYFSIVMKSNNGIAHEGMDSRYDWEKRSPVTKHTSEDGENWTESDRNFCLKAFTVPDYDNNPDLMITELSSDNFPDEVFREYLRDFDFDDNGYLGQRELEAIESISLENSGLHSLKGIELLPYVVSLDVSRNSLKAVDLSANTELQYLSCYSQDVSGLVLTKKDDNLYSVNLKEYISGDISRIIPGSVRVNSGDVSYDIDTGVAEFGYMASSVNYEYDTGFNGHAMSVTAHVYYDEPGFVNIDAINFPDYSFRESVKVFDTDKDGWLSEEERNAAKKLTVYTKNGKAESLKGIEHFPALKELYCSHHNLTALDVTHNTALEILDCSYNKIAVLDVSRNESLTSLLCGNNQIESLDVSHNTALKILSCPRNKLSVIDVKSLNDLQELTVNNNLITALDISGNTELTTLVCYCNSLTELDLSNHTKLYRVQLFGTAYVDYDDQTRSGLNVTRSNGKYIVSLKDYVSDITRINPQSVKDTGGTSCDYDSENGLAVFDSFPKGLYYEYDTGYTKAESFQEGYRYMDVTITNDIALVIPSIKDSVLPEGFAGAEYNFALTVTGFPSPDVTASNLPDGVSMDNAGKISGIPQKSGRYTVKVTAMNDAGEYSKKFTLKINAKKNLKITPAALTNANWNRKYTKAFRLSGVKSLSWKISGDLPEGLAFNSSTAKISGTPKQAGTFTFTISATNGALTVSKNYTLKVKGVAPKLKGSLKSGKVGEKYYSLLKATGTTPITWSIPGLPEGLSYDVNDDGTMCEISGIPSAGNKNKISVTLSNAAGNLTKNFQLRVNYVRPKILTKSLPQGRQYEEYPTAKLEASGSPVITWSWSGKKIPAGMNLAEDGTLSGIPSGYGKFSAKITAANPGGKTSRTFTIIIAKSENEANDAESESESQSQTYSEKNAESFTQSTNQSDKNREILHGHEYIAAVIPSVEIDEEGMYEFPLSLDVNVPEGLTLNCRVDSDDAVFFDDDGEMIDFVPENHSVTLGVWLEPGRVYEIVIYAKP